jgi:hypothetical protein
MSNTRFNNNGAHVMRSGALCACGQSPPSAIVFCAGAGTT